MRTLMLAWFIAAGYLALQGILVLNGIQGERLVPIVPYSECQR